MTTIVISSGHGAKVPGADGIINEVEQARRVVDALAAELESRGVNVIVYHDNTSTSQGQNLDAICAAHNRETRDVDLSVHFNAFEQREGPVGTEVWYISQKNLAAQLSAAMADGGDFIDRGAKYTDDLRFLNSTEKPACLLEVCFVDSEEDCRLYEANFSTIIESLADVFAEGEEEITEPVPPPGEEIIPPRVDISVSGDVLIFVNGDQVGTKG